MKFSAAVIPAPIVSSDSTTHPAPNSPGATLEAASEPDAPNLSEAQASATPGATPGQKQDESNSAGFWRVFFSTFGTIFLAEIGDKTQVTTLLMSAESHSPWTVFAGAGSALIATSLLGVLLGQWLSKRIKPTTLDRAAGITLLVITGWLVWDIGGF